MFSRAALLDCVLSPDDVPLWVLSEAVDSELLSFLFPGGFWTGKSGGIHSEAADELVVNPLKQQSIFISQVPLVDLRGLILPNYRVVVG